LAEPTLDFVAQQQQRIIDELRESREREERLSDDMGVLLAMMQRLDGTVQGLVSEVRAEQSRFSRLERRVREIETSPPRGEA
jgi:predicted  nucleic acid-binding Zn-ribbon protein